MRGADLPHAIQDDLTLDLVAQYTPLILFDREEPFLPLIAGYTVFRKDGDSPSFPRSIQLAEAGRPTAALVIEYAIWWDWDIKHLYELEHFWTYVDDLGNAIYAEGSWHGFFGPMRMEDGLTLCETHPIIYSQPGKHAFAPSPKVFLEHKEDCARSCLEAGETGLLVTPLYKGVLKKTQEADDLVLSYLKPRAFIPSFVFDRPFPIAREMLIPWPVLRDWIPARVNYCLEQIKNGSWK